MLEELMNANVANLKRAERTIEHRVNWEQISRIEKLERALRAARGTLHVLPNLSPKAN